MRIAIIGVGGVAYWMAREFSKSCEVAIYDRDSTKMRVLKDMIHLQSFEDLRSFCPQFLLNAVSLQNTVAAFEAASPFLRKDGLIADIASIKGEIPGYYRKSPFRFISCHPRFGPKFDNLNKLEDENFIIISKSDEDGKKFLINFFHLPGHGKRSDLPG